MPAALKLEGCKFERLTVIERIHQHTRPVGYSYWKCICQCGKTHIASSQSLRSGDTKSCGCLKKETDAGLLVKGIKRRFPRNPDRKNQLLKDIYGTYKARAKKKKLLFDISFDEFTAITTESEICSYCGGPPDLKWNARYKDVQLRAFTLDRVDSNAGYSLDNVVPCCRICNTIKMEMPYSEFIHHIKEILKRQEAICLK